MTDSTAQNIDSPADNYECPYTRDEFVKRTHKFLEDLRDPAHLKENLCIAENQDLVNDLLPRKRDTALNILELANTSPIVEAEAQVLIEGFTALIHGNWLRAIQGPLDRNSPVLNGIIEVIRARLHSPNYVEAWRSMINSAKDILMYDEMGKDFLECFLHSSIQLATWAFTVREIFIPATEKPENVHSHKLTVLESFRAETALILTLLDDPHVEGEDTPPVSCTVHQILYSHYYDVAYRSRDEMQALNVVRLISTGIKEFIAATPESTATPELWNQLKYITQLREEAFVATGGGAFAGEEDSELEVPTFIPDFLLMATTMLQNIRMFIASKHQFTMRQALVLGALLDRVGAYSSDSQFCLMSPTGASLRDILRQPRRPATPGESCNKCDRALPGIKQAPDEEVLILRCGHWFHPLCISRELRERGVCPVCQDPISDRIKVAINGDQQEKNFPVTEVAKHMSKEALAGDELWPGYSSDASPYPKNLLESEVEDWETFKYWYQGDKVHMIPLPEPNFPTGNKSLKDGKMDKSDLGLLMQEVQDVRLALGQPFLYDERNEPISLTGLFNQDQLVPIRSSLEEPEDARIRSSSVESRKRTSSSDSSSDEGEIEQTKAEREESKKRRGSGETRKEPSKKAKVNPPKAKKERKLKKDRKSKRKEKGKKD